MTRKELAQAIIEYFEGQGLGCCKAKSKGDGFFIQGKGFVRFNDARKLAGLPRHTVKVERQVRQAPWGDYAVVAMLNGIQSDGERVQ